MIFDSPILINPPKNEPQKSKFLPFGENKTPKKETYKNVEYVMIIQTSFLNLIQRKVIGSKVGFLENRRKEYKDVIKELFVKLRDRKQHYCRPYCTSRIKDFPSPTRIIFTINTQNSMHDIFHPNFEQKRFTVFEISFYL